MYLFGADLGSSPADCHESVTHAPHGTTYHHHRLSNTWSIDLVNSEVSFHPNLTLEPTNSHVNCTVKYDRYADTLVGALVVQWAPPRAVRTVQTWVQILLPSST